jgi:hypothetical protein
MATSEATAPKTAADLNRWLAEIGERLEERTEAVAHGDTALTLLDVEESTTDVDFSFREAEEFRRFRELLLDAGYRVTRDFRPRPGETYLRLRHPGQIVDTVDLRYPTWNGWHITQKVLGSALMVPLGRVVLVRPGVEAVFLFKTYPLRDTDLDDLRKILEKKEIDEAGVIDLFEEQDRLYRRRFDTEGIGYEPVLNVVEMRVRLAASLQLLGRQHSGMVPEIHRHARTVFQELRLPHSLMELAQLLRDEESIVNWDEVLGEHIEAIRSRLRI